MVDDYMTGHVNMIRSFYVYGKYLRFCHVLEYRAGKGISPGCFPQAEHRPAEALRYLISGDS